jgi:hypothetical protein
MSAGTKRPEDQMSVEQNVQRDKMSGDIHIKPRRRDKRSKTQHPFSLYSVNSTYIFFFTQGIIHSLSPVYRYNVIVRMLTVLINIKDYVCF